MTHEEACKAGAQRCVEESKASVRNSYVLAAQMVIIGLWCVAVIFCPEWVKDATLGILAVASFVIAGSMLQFRKLAFDQWMKIRQDYLDMSKK